MLKLKSNGLRCYYVKKMVTYVMLLIIYDVFYQNMRDCHF